MTANGETIGEIMTNILEYQYDGGYNCLPLCYELLTLYKSKGNDPNPMPMKTEIEKTIEFLITMGRDSEVDMPRVINNVGNHGQTLFVRSSAYSEKISLLLTRMNVKVNEIDSFFQTAQFKVNRKLITKIS